MVITNIERQKRNPHRINLYLDGNFAFGIHEDVLRRFAFRKGDHLEENRVAEIERCEEFHLAKEKAMRLLHYRSRSEKELRVRLRDEEFHPAVVDEVIVSLQSGGFINDTNFARAFIHDTLMRKPAGKNYFQRTLRTKGISKEIIQDVLQDAGTAEQEQELALTTAKKLLSRYSSSRTAIDRDKQQQRIVGFLSRRGFDWQTIRSVVQTLFSR